MISFASFDMMARGGTIALLALWSVLLIRDHWSALPARVALCMNFAIAAHVITSISSTAKGSETIELLLVLASTSVPSFFWLFTKTWFNDESEVSRVSKALVITSMALTGLNIWINNGQGVRGSEALLGPVARASMFGFAFWGLWIAWRGRDNDLVEARRELRARFVWAVGCFVIVTLVLELMVHRGFAPRYFLSIIEIGAMMLTWMLCIEMLALRNTDLFSLSQPSRTPTTPPDDEPLRQRLAAFMQSELPHRDETMTIAKLASLLGEQEYRVRRLINGTLGHRNFAAFLNGYRLSEVRDALGDPEQRDVPILTIALDSGFGSLGPFNRAFREAEGMTPSDYRSQSLQKR
jgi:AraC-like DNA-binding protein